MPETRSYRESLRRFRLGPLVLIALIVAVAVSTVVAAESSSESELDWLGQYADPHPATGEVPATFDPASGESRILDTSGTQERDTSDADQTDYQQIFHPDQRERVTPTTSFPASAVAQIEMYAGGLRIGTCTGTLVGPNAVLTAGHCLYDETTGWADAISVVPGRDGDAEPFGFQWASSAWVPEQWSRSMNPSWDWGILRMPDTSMADTVGWFQIGVLNTSSLTSSDFQPVIKGYPGDKQYGTMWRGTEPDFVDVTRAHLHHQIDTFSGQSGSAIWRGSDSVVVGIHMGSISDANIGSRIDEELLESILEGCAALDCELSYFVEGETPEPQPAMPPASDAAASPPGESDPDPAGQPGDVHPIESPYYENTWQRTDGPVRDGHADRTWMWGPAPFTPAIDEPYLGAPGEQRAVQYFDKSRMEITDPDGDPNSIWYVTNGLLTYELITGERQIGDDVFEQYSPAEINVAGDADDPDAPTYASFAAAMDYDSEPVGEVITRSIDRDGEISSLPEFADHDVRAAHHVPETGHTVASPFWEFMNSSDSVYEDGSLTTGPLFENPFYATGYPLTDAYWTTVQIGGEPQIVLIQMFERRVLTYTPDNPAGWQVEAGNVGSHYFTWRYTMEPDR